MQRSAGSQSKDLAIHFRLALEELGPAFVKLGQLLSTRPDLLPPPFLAELTKLLDTVPGEPWEAIHPILVREFGRDPEKVFATIDFWREWLDETPEVRLTVSHEHYTHGIY